MLDTTKHQLNKCPDHEELRGISKAKLKHKYTDITDMLFTTDQKEIKLLTTYNKKLMKQKGKNSNRKSKTNQKPKLTMMIMKKMKKHKP